MEEDNVAIRLKGFIQALGVTNSQFADKCGIPRPSLSQLLGGRNKKISDVIVGQIHQAYPEMNVLWLLFGEGPMMVGSNSEFSSFENQNSLQVNKNIQSDNLESQPGTINFQSNQLSAEDGFESASNIGQNGAISMNLFNQQEKIPTNHRSLQNYGNVRTLNQQKNGFNTTVKQEVEVDARVAGLLKQIEQMKKNPRKVSQITIYYDDSTFETFYPK